MSKVRTREPQRRQGIIRFEMPEDALPATHTARILWELSGTLDLRTFTRNARAIEGHAGRLTSSPRMLLCVWLYAISQGIGSAREIARLCHSDAAFRWIVGDVSVSHQVLSEFRVGHRATFDALMTDVLASLMHKGLSLDMVAQDGTRVRASASAPSFRRYGSLLECRARHREGDVRHAPRVARLQLAPAREHSARVTCSQLSAFAARPYLSIWRHTFSCRRE